jgi:hypothetical protein
MSVCVSPIPIIARQWLGKNVTVARNTNTIQELLDAFFYAVRVVSRKVGDYFFPELLVKFCFASIHSNL